MHRKVSLGRLAGGEINMTIDVARSRFLTLGCANDLLVALHMAFDPARRRRKQNILGNL
jgi:hypothetical protein